MKTKSLKALLRGGPLDGAQAELERLLPVHSTLVQVAWNPEAPGWVEHKYRATGAIDFEAGTQEFDWNP